ncbi:MAG TPA: glycosyltransferase family 2 protein [Arenicellales bacterium]|nr:glycosyltransferase family 2 protein [Arenicellales bacterium]
MKPGDAQLWAVMPVYNESASLRSVVEEWLSCFRTHVESFRLGLINDGSTDETPELMRELAAANPELLCVDKPNTGHGRSCIYGYRLALEAGAQYVFQIDSDGQCRPSDFTALWRQRERCAAVFGRRSLREDSVVRRLVSRLLTAQIALCAGIWVPDANVPYRLIRADLLSEALEQVPEDIDLANVALAMVLQRRRRICWVDIGFRPRTGGVSATGLTALALKSCRLAPQLWRLRRTLGQP